jgi:4,5-dihydroxyphthalate decarboxylase
VRPGAALHYPPTFHQLVPSRFHCLPTTGLEAIGSLTEAYYRKTGMFPIMHMMAVRKSLAEEHPWLPGSVFKACLQARNLAAEEIKSIGMYYAMMPWLTDDLARVQAVMGSNPWPYGVNSNRNELEAMLRWSFEQGLSPRHALIEEIFAPGLTQALWDTENSP